MEITNRDSVINELASILQRLDKELRKYQTDIYAYAKEDGTVELYEFVNIGGNSWLNDDHTTIYKDGPRYVGKIDFFTTVEELADAVGLTVEKLTAEAKSFYDLDDDDRISTQDVYQYVAETYDDKIDEAFDALDFDVDYSERAEEIISDYENGIDGKDGIDA